MRRLSASSRNAGAATDGLGHRLGAQRAVDFLGEHRDEGRGELGEGDQHVVERLVGLSLVAVGLGLPEASAGAADIPVGEVVDEGGEASGGLLEVIGVEGGGDVGDDAHESGEDPAVEVVVEPGGRLGLASRWLPAVDFGVGGEEAEGVPEREDGGSDDLLDAALGEAQVLGADDGRVEEEEPQRVGAVLVDDLLGCGVVLEALGHLAPVLGEDEAIDDDVPEGGLVEEDGGEDMERVEPAAGLVKAPGDEVGGEAGLDLLAVLEGVVVLGVGHGAGLEPAVEDLRRAAVGLAVAADDDLVDEVLVQVGDLLAGECLQLGDGADADHVGGVLLADPDGDAGAPEAVAGDVPVLGVGQPVAEALVADVLGHPADDGVVGGQALVEVLDADVPGLDGAVDEGCVGAVAEGVGVDDGALGDELATVLEAPDDGLVGLLAVEALPLGDLVGELGLDVEGVDEVDAGGAADAVVVLAVGGRLVDDAGAVGGGDVAVDEDLEGVGLVLVVVEDGLVVESAELLALAGPEDGVLVG